MPRGGRRAGAGTQPNIQRTRAIFERFKRRVAAGDKQAEIIADLADEYGVLKPAIRRQIHLGSSPAFAALVRDQIARAPLAQDAELTTDPATTWCAQCEKSVTESRAASCASPFCKARDTIGKPAIATEAGAGEAPKRLDGEAAKARPDAKQ